MCLIVFALERHPRYPLLLAANRDERYLRPTAPAAFWEEDVDVLAGRDLEAGGTWFGMTRRGRIAGITNFRSGPPNLAPIGRSRGLLVSDYLRDTGDADAYGATLRATRGDYRPYSLLYGDWRRLCCYSSASDRVQEVPPGVHALSNHLLDTPWPKVAHARETLARIAQADAPIDPERIFDLMRDRAIAADGELPDTGVGRDLERRLSPIFIQTPSYGTRSTTVLLVDRDLEVLFHERTFDAAGCCSGDRINRFRLRPDGTLATPGAFGQDARANSPGRT